MNFPLASRQGAAAKLAPAADMANAKVAARTLVLRTIFSLENALGMIVRFL
jgi:hypothetical protein